MNWTLFQPAADAYCMNAGLSAHEYLPFVDEFGCPMMLPRRDIIAREMYHMAMKMQAMKQAGLLG